MSDSHKGELNAIKASFPGIVRLRCYFHLIQNLQKKVRDFDLKPKMEYIIWVTKTLREAKTSLKRQVTKNLSMLLNKIMLILIPFGLMVVPLLANRNVTTP